MASQTEDKADRPNLILVSQNVGSLDKVLGAVTDYHAQRSRSQIAIAVANSDRLRECEIGLPSATGVFPAFDPQLHTRATPPAAHPPSRVMQRSSNGALTLTINWTTDLALEAVKGHRLVDCDVQEDLPPAALEFHELFDRHPPVEGYLECVRKELDLLNNLVQKNILADAEGFTYRTKYGVKQNEPFSLDDMSASGEYVMKAIQALSYIKSHKSAEWVTKPGVVGHIEFSEPTFGEFNVMAWANHVYHIRDMETDLFL